jgi:hypothetical protein
MRYDLSGSQRWDSSDFLADSHGRLAVDEVVAAF